jgi:hypothetical protein
MMSISGLGEVEHLGGGKRGDIQVFSAGSRYRLFRLLHQLTFDKVTFMTLTYPNEFPTDARVYKANLKEFHRKFEIEYPGVQGVWRLEFQERGAPHFHIMWLDWQPKDDGEAQWIWKSTCHTWDMAHELLGVDIRVVTDNTQQALIAFYMAKYIAKIDERKIKDDERKCGRWWGKWNINEPEPYQFEVSDREAEQLTAFAIGARVSNSLWTPIDPTLCTVFGSSLGSGLFGELIRGYETFLRRPSGSRPIDN